MLGDKTDAPPVHRWANHGELVSLHNSNGLFIQVDVLINAGMLWSNGARCSKILGMGSI